MTPETLASVFGLLIVLIAFMFAIVLQPSIYRCRIGWHDRHIHPKDIGSSEHEVYAKSTCSQCGIERIISFDKEKNK